MKSKIPRFSLVRGLVRQSYNKQNLYNLYKKRIFRFDRGTRFQKEWESKRETRAYHGENIREKIWRTEFDARLQMVAPISHRKSTVGIKSNNRNKNNNNSEVIPAQVQTYAPMERRLDTAVFRALFASSVKQARHFILEGNVRVNGIIIKSPSYKLKAGDIFSVDPTYVLYALGRSKPSEDESNTINVRSRKKYAKFIKRYSNDPNFRWAARQRDIHRKIPLKVRNLSIQKRTNRANIFRKTYLWLEDYLRLAVKLNYFQNNNSIQKPINSESFDANPLTDLQKKQESVKKDGVKNEKQKQNQKESESESDNEKPVSSSKLTPWIDLPPSTFVSLIRRKNILNEALYKLNLTVDRKGNKKRKLTEEEIKNKLNKLKFNNRVYRLVRYKLDALRMSWVFPQYRNDYPNYDNTKNLSQYYYNLVNWNLPEQVDKIKELQEIIRKQPGIVEKLINLEKEAKELSSPTIVDNITLKTISNENLKGENFKDINKKPTSVKNVCKQVSDIVGIEFYKAVKSLLEMRLKYSIKLSTCTNSKHDLTNFDISKTDPKEQRRYTNYTENIKEKLKQIDKDKEKFLRTPAPFESHSFGLKEPKKLYFTPWEPRPFLAPWMILPHHIEVNFETCHAIYMRDPVARPGMSEISTPLPLIAYTNSYSFYLRHRPKKRGTKRVTV